jgi:hypothetical protein
MSRQFNHYITEELTDVRGGAGAGVPQLQAPVKVPQLAGPAKVPQLAPPKPYGGMAPPKYSAGWWDFVRARGLDK